jgi:hypothetical protein
MTKTWFVDGQIIEEPIPEAEMNTNRSGNLHEVMHQAAWDSATRVPEGDIRALKHRIHELEGEVVGYKQILDTQPEPAECDGGQCGIGGYCKQCPKTQPDPEPVAWISHNAGLYHGKPDESLNPLPLYTAPPQREWMEQERAVGYREGHQAALKQREWQGLTDEEYETMAEQHVTNCYFDTLKYAKAIEAKLKDNNYDKR